MSNRLFRSFALSLTLAMCGVVGGSQTTPIHHHSAALSQPVYSGNDPGGGGPTNDCPTCNPA